CIICEIPKVVQNDEKQLHNVNGPAVTWRDGWEQYFVSGRNLSPEVFQSIKEKKYTPEQFFKEGNEEEKSAAIAMMQELYGDEHIVDFFRQHLKEVDSFVDKKEEKYLEGTTKGMNVGVYT